MQPSQGSAIIYLLNIKDVKKVHNTYLHVYIYIYIYIYHIYTIYTSIKASLLTWAPERRNKLFFTTTMKAQGPPKTQLMHLW